MQSAHLCSGKFCHRYTMQGFECPCFTTRLKGKAGNGKRHVHVLVCFCFVRAVNFKAVLIGACFQAACLLNCGKASHLLVSFRPLCNVLMLRFLNPCRANYKPLGVCRCSLQCIAQCLWGFQILYISRYKNLGRVRLLGKRNCRRIVNSFALYPSCCFYPLQRGVDSDCLVIVQLFGCRFRTNNQDASKAGDSGCRSCNLNLDINNIA